MEKSLRITLMNLQNTIVTQRVLQHNQKRSWYEKASDVWQKVFGDIKPAMTPPFWPPWTYTGSHTFELTGQKTLTLHWTMQ